MTAQHASVAEPARDAEVGWELAARVVLPLTVDEDVLPLYLEGGRRYPGVDDRFDRQVRGWGDNRNAQTPPEGEPRSLAGQVLGRTAVRVPADERISFATYFNAFPASYWRHWTTISAVRLVVQTEGELTLIVYKSNARGVAQQVQRTAIGPGAATTQVDLDLGSFVDGGWYWFDLVGAGVDSRLTQAEWQVRGSRRRDPRLSIGITTINRVDFCRATVAAIAADSELRAHLDTLYVVDQGTDHVDEAPGVDRLIDELGPQMRIIRQANLGGSGGFSRGMYESLKADRSTFHLVLDDDVRIEPEAILRAVRFAAYTRVATIVGAHMFDLHNPTTLHSFGEAIETDRFWWGPVRGVKEEWNLAFDGLRETPWLHRRTDVHFNGWWMCLIPLEVIRTIGLSLPVFIKWDDAEYGVRARAAGFPTVSLPGAGVWHVSWNDKDDTIDWQAYYHQRNWLLAALLHSPLPHGGTALKESFQWLAKNGFSMRYYANAARILGLNDLLDGPDHLAATLAGRLPILRAMQGDYVDTRFSPDPDAFPAPTGLGLVGSAPTMPPRSKLLPWAAKTAITHLRATDPAAMQRPQAVIPYRYAVWWYLSQFDSAVVSKADGTGAAFYQRDRQLFRSQLVEGARLHTRLYREWESLATAYRQALPELTSPRAWARTFGLDSTS